MLSHLEHHRIHRRLDVRIIAPAEFVQSEQSVVVNGYGAFVVNNIRLQGHKDNLVDVIAGGPVFDPPTGCERVEWNPETRQWRSVWTRNNVTGTSMVPSSERVFKEGIFNRQPETRNSRRKSSTIGILETHRRQKPAFGRRFCSEKDIFRKPHWLAGELGAPALTIKSPIIPCTSSFL